MSRSMSRMEMAAGGLRFFRYLTTGGLFNINLEVTKRCNARCDFCDYWTETPAAELPDYVPVVHKLQPLSVSLTGGEPLLRDDLPELIAALRGGFRFLFISLITNGRLLTVERGCQLWAAGLDELSISLDYLDERHDNARRMRGLTAHILSLAPALRRSGIPLCFNVVLKKDNFREVPAIVRWAAERDVKVSVSTYNCWRVNNEEHMIPPDELHALREVIGELKRLQRQLGNLTSSEFYLDRIPEFFTAREIPGCTAGRNWLQVTPDGMIKRCSDHHVAGHYTAWHRSYFPGTTCGRCWYSCRGAAQEPWTWGRFAGMAREALNLEPVRSGP